MGQTSHNPGIEYIVKKGSRAAMKTLVTRLGKRGQMSRVSPAVWRIIKGTLSDNWVYTSADEKATIQAIDLHLDQ